MTRTLRRPVAGALAVITVGLIWFVLQVFPIGGTGRQVIVTVHQGDSMTTIINEIHAKGVINSPLAFRVETLLLGSPNVRPGAYEIAQNSSFASVRSILGGGPNVLVVQVIPGLTLHEVALQIAADKGNAFASAFLRAADTAAQQSPYRPDLSPPALPGMAENVNALEGLIGVGDYVIAPSDTPAMVLARMTTAFTRETALVGLSVSSRLDGLSAYQLVIAASIVEREGYIASNMPKVARVILNRLQRGEGLQMDSTVKYPLGLDSGAVTVAMLQHTLSPYNTYKSAGLTPTPICTVSTTALDAILHAPPGPWLYFVVVQKDGTEAFSSTYDGQKKNEQLARSRGL